MISVNGKQLAANKSGRLVELEIAVLDQASRPGYNQFLQRLDENALTLTADSLFSMAVELDILVRITNRVRLEGLMTNDNVRRGSIYRGQAQGAASNTSV